VGDVWDGVIIEAKGITKSMNSLIMNTVELYDSSFSLGMIGHQETFTSISENINLVHLDFELLNMSIIVHYIGTTIIHIEILVSHS